MAKNLFGDEIIENALLRDKFIEPPFSILNTTGREWMTRRRIWKNLGIQSEVGRDVVVIGNNFSGDAYRKGHSRRDMKEQSIFDPSLTELMLRWFCPDGGTVLDPFAGGSVRGIVTAYSGYKYVGIELREEQVRANIEQACEILPEEKQPRWVCGDSAQVLNNDLMLNHFDMILSCPPYADLEVYSKLPADISNMPYDKFVSFYRVIIELAVRKLKPGGYAAWVVAEIRDPKTGYMRTFLDDTKAAFRDAGAGLWNDIVLVNAYGTAMLRTRQMEVNRKVVKVHQNVLVFKKYGGGK